MNYKLSKVSKIEQVLNRLEDPKYSYTSEIGRVISMDSIDVAHVGNSQGRIETIYSAVSLDNGQTQTLVVFNRSVTLPLSKDDELWVVGRRQIAGRLRAMAVVVPSLQMYADLTSDSSFIQSIRFHVLVSGLIGLAGYVLSTFPTQFFFGLGLMALSVVLLTTGLCLKLVCGVREVNAMRASTNEWLSIERTFGRADKLVE
jgi:hypothetical protein